MPTAIEPLNDSTPFGVTDPSIVTSIAVARRDVEMPHARLLADHRQLELAPFDAFAAPFRVLELGSQREPAELPTESKVTRTTLSVVDSKMRCVRSSDSRE